MAFTHLHLHTGYSLLDGACRPEELAAKAEAMGMKSLAITDHGVMYGVIEFYRACKAHNVKPVLGCEVYVAPGSRFDREPASKDDLLADTRYFHLILLAENNTGYANLVKIVSYGFTDGFYYRPRVDLEILEKYHEGIICMSACMSGEVARYLRMGLYEEAKTVALRYRSIFGEKNYFLEMQDHGISEQKLINQGLMRMSQETGIPLVVTNDVHYLNADDAEAHDALLCIQTNKKLTDEDRPHYAGGQFYFKSEEEMRQRFPYALDAIDRTREIADRCNVEIEFDVQKLPKYPVPEGMTAWEYLQKLCYEGFEKRYHGAGDSGWSHEQLKERLEYELNTIRNMGYVDYFLIVWDYIHYSRSQGSMVGPGRGSAAGSIVAYCLEITNINPIRFQLIFERFLNPERVTMPDIDVDFEPNFRANVYEYVRQKYGPDQVTQIITFGTLQAKGVVRDVGRVMDLPYALCDQIAKLIPMEKDMTLQKALETVKELKELYDSDPRIQKLFALAERLEGLPRHTSIHAAGVVISEKPLIEYAPISRSSDGSITTQYEWGTMESLGLLKMDFLGLRNLTVIMDALRLIRKTEGINLDIDHIDMDDPNVYGMIGAGHCEGVFQLESRGMTAFMKELKPETIEDIIAGISLYRPGPMDFIPKYIKGKNNKAAISYDCPQMEPILEPTHGCIVYQEQVMQIVRDLAGYSMGRSDMVRRAMSKKKESVMVKERANFVYGNEEEHVPGCVSKGIAPEVANKIFDEMMDFAKYAFNKSHAAAYAVVTYETAYLKYYYPAEYMAALMTSVMSDVNKVTGYIQACRKMGLRILPPDINEGESGFSVGLADGRKCIRYGLSALKSVGISVIDRIVEERETNGRFTDLENFINRLNSREVNKRTVESFIKAGALDSMPGTRKQKMMVYGNIIDEVTRDRRSNIAGQMSLFEMMEEKKPMHFPNVGEYSEDIRFQFEKEVMGLYVSGHPLQADEELLRKNVTATSQDFVGGEEDENEGIITARDQNLKDGQWVVVGGMIAAKRVQTTRHNTMMAFVTLEDLYGTLEVIVFPKDYERYRSELDQDAKILVRGRVQLSDTEAARVICSQIIPFRDVPKEVWIQFETRAAYLEVQDRLLQLIRPYDGSDTVVIYLKDERAYKKLPANYSIEAGEKLLAVLKAEFGEKNVKVVQKSIENSTKMH